MILNEKLRFKYLLQLGTLWFFHSDTAPASSEVFSAVCWPRCSSHATLPHGGPEAAQAIQHKQNSTEFYNALDILGCQKYVFAQLVF